MRAGSVGHIALYLSIQIVVLLIKHISILYRTICIKLSVNVQFLSYCSNKSRLYIKNTYVTVNIAINIWSKLCLSVLCGAR